ncbi:MAG: AAA family ATPase [Myxococcales bacterium]|nr:MAG: AAA family ATPase [Myxococcales bacterium]
MLYDKDSSKRCSRIVLTGGPGGGKTTAADLFRREIGERVVVVPETATMLFAGGFPRVDNLHARQAAQQAIFHVQRNLEDIQFANYPGRILLCDRGTVDGAAYWTDGPDEFFLKVGSSLEVELKRYDAVLFFESAAVGGLEIEGGNPQRIEDIEDAKALDLRLRKLWSAHPNYFFIPHNSSFFQKITFAFAALENFIGQLGG